MLSRFKRLPFELRVALIANIALLVANFLWFGSQFGARIDPGLATLLGATIGLGIVGWQTNRGFRNLIRSQANHAGLDREARLHKLELEEDAKDRQTRRDVRLLQSSIRAELAAIYSKVVEQTSLAKWNYEIYHALAKAKTPSTAKEYKVLGIDAPVFKANLSRIGLLGTDFGADVIKVLSKADGASPSMTFDIPITQEILAALSAARHSYLQKWGSDLFHVAMRIRAVEENTPDPGSLITTETERHAKLKEIG